MPFDWREAYHTRRELRIWGKDEPGGADWEFRRRISQLPFESNSEVFLVEGEHKFTKDFETYVGI